jgi:hypothetical protein
MKLNWSLMKTLSSKPKQTIGHFSTYEERATNRPTSASKFITMRIKDTLQPATTYSFNFGQSICNNEEIHLISSNISFQPTILIPWL